MRIALIFILLLGFTVGCAIDEAADIAAYRSVLDAGLRERPTPPADGESLDVVRAMQLANHHDELLAAEGESYVRAVIERQRAVARFLPRITFAPSLVVRGGDESGVRGALDLPIDGRIETNPFADIQALRRVDLSAEARRAFLYVAQDQLLLDVGRVHFNILISERRADVLRNSLVVQEARVEDARARADVGFQRPLDVALAESRAADARTQLVDAEAAARTGRATLAFLTATSLGNRLLESRLDVPEEVPEVEALIDTALRTRPEIRAAERSVAAALASVEESYRAYWPSVALNFTAFLSRDTEPTDLDWTSFIQISVPLFQAGLIEANVRTALSDLREAKLLFVRSSRAVTRDIQTERELFVSTRRRLMELNARLRAARSAQDLADAQWSAGLATNLERLTAQDELLAAELEIATTELELKIRYLELLWAEGSLFRVAGLTREESDAVAR